MTHGWPSTQPNRTTLNLAAYHWAAHNPTARWCAGSVACSLHPDSNAGCPNVGPTSGRSLRHWTTVGTTYIVVWLVVKQHTIEPAHHRTAGLCAVRWCAARLCVIRLGYVEGHLCDIKPFPHYTLLFCGGNQPAITGFSSRIDQWYGAFCFLCCSHEESVEQMALSVIWDGRHEAHMTSLSSHLIISANNDVCYVADLQWVTARPPCPRWGHCPAWWKSNMDSQGHSWRYNYYYHPR